MLDAVENATRSTFLPPPRVPQSASAAWPPVDLVAALDPDAGAVVAAADQVRREVQDAITALTQSRPGGDAWLAARRADRDLVLRASGKPGAPKHLAQLLAGDPTRYGTALALASTVSERLDALRGRLASDTLIKKVDEKREQVDQQIADAALNAFDAASDDQKGVGYTALERYDALVGQGRQLLALRRWLTGETSAFDPSPPYPVPRRVLDAARDARLLLAGGTPLHKQVAS